MQLHGPESRPKFLSGRIAPALLFQDDFGQYWQQQVKEPFTGYSFLRPDSKTFRFEVHEGDRASFDGGTVDRAEVYETTGAGSATPNSLPLDTSLWFAGSLTLQSANQADWCLVTQWHATEDVGDISTSPPLSLYLDNAGHLIVESRASSANPLLTTPPATIHYTGNIGTTRTNLVVNVKFNHLGGFLKVWRDGVQIVDYTGAIGYNDAAGPYHKCGVYRSTHSSPMVLDWRNVEMGSADLTDRILNPLP